MLAGLLLRIGLPLLLAGGSVAVLWWRVNDAAYDRGYEARDKEARAYIEKLETRLAERMRRNEGLTTEEIDCQLRRLRNPKAECGK